MDERCPRCEQHTRNTHRLRLCLGLAKLVTAALLTSEMSICMLLLDYIYIRMSSISVVDSVPHQSGFHVAASFALYVAGPRGYAHRQV